MKSMPAKHNNITLTVVPNPHFLQTIISDEDELSHGHTLISSEHIKRIEITKSYLEHVTSIEIDLVSVEHGPMSALQEGKNLLLLTIEALHGDTDKAFSTYLMCDKLVPTGTGQHGGTYKTINVSIYLKSVTRQRLELENNFTFLLGGKGHYGAVGSNSSPFEFLQKDFLQLYTETYSPESTASQKRPLFNTTSVNTSADADVLITSSPKTGYKIEVDTNMDTFKFFFEHYPILKTPYSWLIDDTPLDSDRSDLYIKDFLRYDSWKSTIDPTLSAYLGGRRSNGNTPGGTDIQDKDVFEYVSLSDHKIIERQSFYNVGRYMIRDSFPMIYAQSVTDNQVIDMSYWNSMAASTYVLTSNAETLKVKQMRNPMYKQFLTFMSPQEIGETQKYHSVFMGLHPELVTYAFDDMYVGDLSIHRSVEILKENLNEESHYGYDRIGTGYHMREVYTPIAINPPDANSPHDEAVRVFEPKFRLCTELTLLVVDQGPMTLEEFDSKARKYSYREVTYDSEEMDYLGVDDCGNPISSNIDDIPSVEPGSAGNSSVAESAASMYNQGFVYIWGGKRSPESGLDCSGFTKLAVKRSGADSGRQSGFPDGTSNQLTWLSQSRNGAQKVTEIGQIQPGDIVFFSNNRTDHGHTGIAKSGSEYYESNSYGMTKAGKAGKGAKIGSFGKRRPSFIFRLKPMVTA